MTSLWLDLRRSRPARAPAPPPLESDLVDLAVVGAGLTGLVTALEAARAGRSVLVIEARTVAGLTTGASTAKISLLQGGKYSTLTRQHSASVARSYAAVNRAAQRWLLDFCEREHVALQRVAAYSYAQTRDADDRVREERDAAAAAGLPVAWGSGPPTADVPFPVSSYVALPAQAQLDPVELCDALAAAVRRHGGVIVEGVRVQAVSDAAGSAPVLLRTEAGEMRARAVVLATGTPILDRGVHFAKVEAERSYLAAFTVPDAQQLVQDMYVSLDSPTRSLRAGAGHLLVGGNGHPVGRGNNTALRAAELLQWTQRYFPGAQPSHQWSAQDYRSLDGLPIVGELVPGTPNVRIATGYAKWGMTNAVAAGRILAACHGGPSAPGADLFSSSRPLVRRNLREFASANSKVGVAMVAGWAKGMVSGADRGDGVAHVGRKGLRPTATCVSGGMRRQVSAVCPHLGGVVRWNEAEHTWDCPLHGSRFAADGELIEGPATRGLTILDEKPADRE